MGKELMSELAIDKDFTSEAFNPDDSGVYKRVDYRRLDGTLYMRSQLSHDLGNGLYGRITQSYYDVTGTIHMYDQAWELQYDINRKIVSKKKVL